MEKLAEDGNKKAAKLLKMLQNPDRFLSTIQISITLAGFLGSAFAADNIASRLTHWLYYGVGFTSLGEQALDVLCVILITLILSYFTLILGELVPKRIAMKNPDKAAMRLCSVVRFFAVIFRPVVWFLSVSTNLVLKMLRIDPKHQDEEVT
ncbi:MAG: DUF21 domain-containing protein, partial [Ruminococcaceae bacterium]|nr:DUF21 domain-containing protein [Oscillospiraceae bacterium]